MKDIPNISYGTTSDKMSKEQQLFYKEVKISLDRDEYIEVGASNWYIDLYVENIICFWEEYGLEILRRKLLNIYKLYNTDEYPCLTVEDYANDCLLGLKKYEDYLECSQIDEIYDYGMSYAYTLRLNVQHYLGLKADPLDIYRFQFPKDSEVIQSNPEKFKKYVIEVFNEYANNDGGWFNIFHGRFKNIIETNDYLILNNCSLPCNKPKPKLDFLIFDYSLLAFGINGLNSTLRKLSTEAENLLRKEIGSSQIDVPWMMETLLYEKVKKEFSDIEVIQHGRPDWLGKQHFDIWIPFWKIAIEYQGPQHFEPIKEFGGEKSLIKTKERDLKKENLAKQNGTILFVVSNDDNQEDLIINIRTLINERKRIMV